MMRGRLRALLGSGVVAGTIVVATVGGPTAAARADTDPTALVGEGGSFLSPVTNLLLNTDSGLGPLNPQYSDSNLDDAVADFVGTAPGKFNADFVVTERPFTSTESATAKSNNRSFAYVPFTATPVAIAVFAVCTLNDLTTGNLTPKTFCPGMRLTPALLGKIFTDGLDLKDGSPLAGWSDSRLTQADGSPIPDSNTIGLASTLLPSAENAALLTIIDSDPTSKQELDDALANPNITPSTTSDTPGETWPFHVAHSYVGGDAGLLGKELTIVSTTNAPASLTNWGTLGPLDGFAHRRVPGFGRLDRVTHRDAVERADGGHFECRQQVRVADRRRSNGSGVLRGREHGRQQPGDVQGGHLERRGVQQHVDGRELPRRSDDRAPGG